MYKSNTRRISDLINFCRENSIQITSTENIYIDFTDQHTETLIPRFSIISGNTKINEIIKSSDYNKLIAHSYTNLEEKIANRFSILCGGPHTGICGCMGLRCGQTSCAQWWIFAFRGKAIYEKAVKIYKENYTEIERVTKELILKKHLT